MFDTRIKAIKGYKNVAMPRGPRLDAPGTLHHVMLRGIEKRDIVTDDKDRDDFVSRMGKLVPETGTIIYAWALLNNHAHILLRSGKAGMSTFMRRLLSGYASNYNRRHDRQGHLFQNRYKSIVCQEDRYFMRLVAYIHLNPLRAGLVASLDDLDAYPWSGHAVVVNVFSNDWQDRDFVLHHFGEKERMAINTYRNFLKEEAQKGRQPELTGGGLVRSIGGWSAVQGMRARKEKQLSDERILGDGSFVSKVLEDAEESVKSQVNVLDFNEIKDKAQADIEDLCEKKGIGLGQLLSGSRIRSVSMVRKTLVKKFVKEYGFSYAETARMLKISTSAAAQIVRNFGDV
ncbi:transposase [Prosthecochloris marina]